jgi:16S rRNA (cytidine1402-2'-O)-methyltransferase
VAATLYIVATPLGNLEDLSPRAARLLREVAVAYAEDTRRSRVLLDHVGAHPKLLSLHEHNERERVAEVLETLSRGDSVALVTDAGTPAVSDPGSIVVSEALAAGHKVSPIPGPSALASALSVAGFTDGDILFVGFLPVKGAERRAVVERVIGHPGVAVLFEAPHRVGATVGELAQAEPERQLCACRELTKIHEEVRRGSLAEMARWAEGDLKGELTLVLGPTTRVAVVAEDAQVDAALRRCLDAGLSARDAAAAVAAVLERSKREVYARCQALR